MAYDIGYDIVVKDDEYSEIKEELNRRAEQFNSYLSQYEAILNTIISEAVKDGKVHTNLESFLETVKTLEGEAQNMAETARKCCDDFVSDMDTADNCIF